MANMSGSNQGLLLATIRYLGLASDNGVPSDDLKRLVGSQGPDREKVWRSILTKSYADIFDPKIDLSRITTDELAEIFQRQGVKSPDRFRKCVTFFTSAAKDAGVKLSPHIRPYVGHTRRRATSQKPAGAATNGASSASAAMPDLPSQLLSKIPDLAPSWPEEELEKWTKMFARICEIYWARPGISSEGNQGG